MSFVSTLSTKFNDISDKAMYRRSNLDIVPITSIINSKQDPKKEIHRLIKW